MVANPEELLKALYVIALDPKISGWLEQHDPRALEQVDRAIVNAEPLAPMQVLTRMGIWTATEGREGAMSKHDDIGAALAHFDCTLHRVADDKGWEVRKRLPEIVPGVPRFSVVYRSRTLRGIERWLNGDASEDVLR